MKEIKVFAYIHPNYHAASFTIDGLRYMAHVHRDILNVGRYSGVIQSCGIVCNNSTFADAVEFISTAIENHFAAFGLNVEFVNV